MYPTYVLYEQVHKLWRLLLIWGRPISKHPMAGYSVSRIVTTSHGILFLERVRMLMLNLWMSAEEENPSISVRLLTSCSMEMKLDCFLECYPRRHSPRREILALVVKCPKNGCANMVGDIEKLFVIGKAQRPRCFGKLDRNSLPVVWRANKKAWMTGTFMEEWLVCSFQFKDESCRETCSSVFG